MEWCNHVHVTPPLSHGGLISTPPRTPSRFPNSNTSKWSLTNSPWQIERQKKNQYPPIVLSHPAANKMSLPPVNYHFSNWVGVCNGLHTPSALMSCMLSLKCLDKMKPGKLHTGLHPSISWSIWKELQQEAFNTRRIPLHLLCVRTQHSLSAQSPEVPSLNTSPPLPLALPHGNLDANRLWISQPLRPNTQLLVNAPNSHHGWDPSYLTSQPIKKATPMYVDNTSAIYIANGEVIQAKLKHIDRWFHYIRNQIDLGFLHVSKFQEPEWRLISWQNLWGWQLSNMLWWSTIFPLLDIGGGGGIVLWLFLTHTHLYLYAPHHIVMSVFNVHLTTLNLCTAVFHSLMYTNPHRVTQ